MMENLSYWERKHFLSAADVLVVGGGIVGMSAAVTLKQQRPHWRVVVVERGSIPRGASTRNAGFACTGSMTELLDDLQSMQEEEVFALVERRWKGLLRLRKRLGDEKIGYQDTGGYETFFEGDDVIWEQCLEKREHFNEAIRQIVGGKDMFIPVDNQRFTPNLKGLRHLMLHTYEGQLDAGAMMRAWYDWARELGVDVLWGMEVEDWEENEAKVAVKVKTYGRLDTQQLLVTTNGFTKQLLPELNIRPARNQVLVTAPIPHLRLKGCFHFDRGYVYFRNLDHRILLGGARNLDPVVETTADLGTNETILQYLMEFLNRIVGEGELPEITHQWSGILGFGPDKQPLIQRLSDRLAVAVGLGGMGVAIGTQVGEEAAQMILRDE